MDQAISRAGMPGLLLLGKILRLRLTRSVPSSRMKTFFPGRNAQATFIKMRQIASPAVLSHNDNLCEFPGRNAQVTFIIVRQIASPALRSRNDNLREFPDRNARATFIGKDLSLSGHAKCALQAGG